MKFTGISVPTLKIFHLLRFVKRVYVGKTKWYVLLF